MNPLADSISWNEYYSCLYPRQIMLNSMHIPFLAVGALNAKSGSHRFLCELILKSAIEMQVV